MVAVKATMIFGGAHAALAGFLIYSLATSRDFGSVAAMSAGYLAFVAIAMAVRLALLGVRDDA
jgi:hypothetical protein